MKQIISKNDINNKSLYTTNFISLTIENLQIYKNKILKRY